MELFVRYCAEAGRFNTLSVSGTLAKTAPPPGFFPLGSGAVFVYAIVELRGKACYQIRPIRLGRPKDSAGI